jgi:hypothetical protein
MMMWAVLVVGVAMIIAPFAMGLPDKADGGQKMIAAFAPIMTEENVQTTSDYYDDVFVPLGDVVPAMSQENIDRFNGYIAGFEALGADVEAMVPALAEATGMTPEQVQGFMGEQFPAMTQMMQALPHPLSASGRYQQRCSGRALSGRPPGKMPALKVGGPSISSIMTNAVSPSYAPSPCNTSEVLPPMDSPPRCSTVPAQRPPSVSRTPVPLPMYSPSPS